MFTERSGGSEMSENQTVICHSTNAYIIPNTYQADVTKTGPYLTDLLQIFK
jgi:hypothetical protein